MTTDPVRTVGDVISIVTVISTIAGWLPPIAALLSIVWLSCQIYAWVVNKKWRPQR